MRIAVLGLGFMGSTHLKALQNIPEAELVAVASNEERKLTGGLSDIQGNLGGPGLKFDFSNVKKFTTAEEAVNDPDTEAVDICLPTAAHYPVALAALKAGKHVLVEKPMALKGAEADELVAEAAQRNLVLMSAHVLRFFPAYRNMVRAVQSGAYGGVHNALFRRRCAAPFWSQWLADKSQSGGGVFDLLIHDIDMAILLMGGAPEAVSATGIEKLAQGIDTVHATLHYSGGRSVVITGGWHHPKAYPFSMEYTVVTEGATFEFSSKTNEAALFNAAGEQHAVSTEGVDGYEAELRYFVNCCRSGEPPVECPPGESAAAVKVGLLMAEARNQNGEKIPCRL